jgi:tetratricopeptide (TPR) repeat protein
MRQAVRANPRSTAFVALAHVLCDVGRPEEAEEVSRQGLRQHPDLPTGYVALARAMLERGHLHDAEQLLTRTAQAHPENGATYRWLGEVLVRMGDRQRARLLLLRAAKLLPGNQRVAQLLSEVERKGEGKVTAPREKSSSEAARPRTDFEATKVASFDAVTKVIKTEAVERELPRTVAGEREVSSQEPAPPPPPDPSRQEPATHVWTPPPKPPQPRTVTPTEIFRRPPGGSVTPPLEILRRALPRRPVARRAALAAAALFGCGALAWQLFSGGASPWDRVGREKEESLRADIAAGTLSRLLRARATVDDIESKLSRRSSAVQLPGALIDGLLLADYGVATPAPTPGGPVASGSATAAGRLSAARQAEQGAARALLALASGDLVEAQRQVALAAAAAPEDRYALLAAAALHHRRGDSEAALVPLRAIAASPGLELVPASLLRAEVELDRGDLQAARGALRGILALAPEHTLARLLLAEVNRAAATAETPGEGAARRAACVRERAASPVVAAGCALSAAVERRLADDRPAALEQARLAASLVPSHPRLMGLTAQALANLGEVDDAAALVDRATRLGGHAMAAVAWARTAVALGRGGAPAVPSGLKAVGADATLVAVRAAHATGGPAAVAQSLATAQGPALVASDPDLRWFDALSRFTERRRAIAFINQLGRRRDLAGGPPAPAPAPAQSHSPPGPVAAYVAGLMAQAADRRHLAAEWLAKALGGHGDICHAARAYAEVLRQLGHDPSRNPALTSMRGCAVKAPAPATRSPRSSTRRRPHFLGADGGAVAGGGAVPAGGAGPIGD